MENKDLFSYKGAAVQACGGIKPGQSGVAGMHISEHRTGGMTAPKISLAAFIFDLMFVYPKTWSAYKTADDRVYVEFGDGTMYLTDGFEYQFKAGSDYHRRYYAVALVVSDLVKGDNKELLTILSNAIDEYKSVGSIAASTAYQFCDSFYYGHNKYVGDYPVDSEIDTGCMEEIKAAFRSGAMQRLDYIFPDMLARSTFETPVEAKVKKRAPEKKMSDFIKDCKDGKYRVAYEWPEQLKGFIKKPEYLDGFEPTNEFVEIVKKIKFRADKILERMDMGLTGADAIGKDALNILLLGKPGTGKTALAYALSAATGMPVCTTAWNKHSEEGEVEGKSRIVDGHPEFVETDSLLFHQFGGIDINEEINLADPSVTMGCLGQKLEFPFIVKKNGYETVVRHPLNVIIGTMNVGTNGSNPLNQALANRFNTPYILDDPTRETFISILCKASKKKKEVCTWVYDAYEASVNYLKSPEVNEDDIVNNLSIRTCLGAIENMEEGQDPKRALVNSIVGAVAVVDLEVARNLQRERIECLKEPSFEF